jgi:hypothetical protein
LSTRNCSALALSDNHGIVSDEKGAVMSAQSRSSTLVVVSVLLAAAIFWPLIGGDRYLFIIWMIILGIPFLDSGSLTLMAVLSLVGLAVLITVTFRSARSVHAGAILAGLLGVYAIGYMVAVIRH